MASGGGNDIPFTPEMKKRRTDLEKILSDQLGNLIEEKKHLMNYDHLQRTDPGKYAEYYRRYQDKKTQYQKQSAEFFLLGGQIETVEARHGVLGQYAMVEPEQHLQHLRNKAREIIALENKRRELNDIIRRGSMGNAAYHRTAAYKKIREKHEAMLYEYIEKYDKYLDLGGKDIDGYRPSELDKMKHTLHKQTMEKNASLKHIQDNMDWMETKPDLYGRLISAHREMQDNYETNWRKYIALTNQIRQSDTTVALPQQQQQQQQQRQLHQTGEWHKESDPHSKAGTSSRQYSYKARTFATDSTNKPKTSAHPSDPAPSTSYQHPSANSSPSQSPSPTHGSSVGHHQQFMQHSHPADSYLGYHKFIPHSHPGHLQLGQNQMMQDSPPSYLQPQNPQSMPQPSTSQYASTSSHMQRQSGSPFSQSSMQPPTVDDQSSMVEPDYQHLLNRVEEQVALDHMGRELNDSHSDDSYRGYQQFIQHSPTGHLQLDHQHMIQHPPPGHLQLGQNQMMQDSPPSYLQPQYPQSMPQPSTSQYASTSSHMQHQPGSPFSQSLVPAPTVDDQSSMVEPDYQHLLNRVEEQVALDRIRREINDSHPDDSYLGYQQFTQHSPPGHLQLGQNQMMQDSPPGYLQHEYPQSSVPARPTVDDQSSMVEPDYQHQLNSVEERVALDHQRRELNDLMENAASPGYHQPFMQHSPPDDSYLGYHQFIQHSPPGHLQPGQNQMMQDSPPGYLQHEYPQGMPQPSTSQYASASSHMLRPQGFPFSQSSMHAPTVDDLNARFRGQVPITAPAHFVEVPEQQQAYSAHQAMHVPTTQVQFHVDTSDTSESESDEGCGVDIRKMLKKFN